MLRVLPKIWKVIYSSWIEEHEDIDGFREQKTWHAGKWEEPATVFCTAASIKEVIDFYQKEGQDVQSIEYIASLSTEINAPIPTVTITNVSG